MGGEMALPALSPVAWYLVVKSFHAYLQQRHSLYAAWGTVVSLDGWPCVSAKGKCKHSGGLAHAADEGGAPRGQKGDVLWGEQRCGEGSGKGAHVREICALRSASFTLCNERRG